MIALASDHEPAEGDFSGLPSNPDSPQTGQQPSNQELPGVGGDLRQSDSVKISKDEARQSSVGKGGKSRGQADEYLVEDDDQADELEEPVRTGLKQVNDQASGGILKNEADIIKNSMIAASNSGLSSSEFFSQPSIQSQPEFPFEPTHNSSSIKSDISKDTQKPQSSIDEKGWLPSLTKATARQPAKPTKSDGQRITAAERLAQLFGSRDASGSALSKADVAIEYLKNMLRNKQNTTTTSGPFALNSTGDRLTSSLATDSTTTRQTNVQRLSAFASKLNQMLNYTAVDTNMTSDSSTRQPAQPELSGLALKRPVRPMNEPQVQQSSLGGFKNLLGNTLVGSKLTPIGQDPSNYRSQLMMALNKQPTHQFGPDSAASEYAESPDELLQSNRLQNQIQQFGLESQHVPIRQQPYINANRVPPETSRVVNYHNAQASPSGLSDHVQAIGLRPNPLRISEHQGEHLYDTRLAGNIPAQSTKYFRMEKLPDLAALSRANQNVQTNHKNQPSSGEQLEVNNNNPIQAYEQQSLDRAPSPKQASSTKEATKLPNRFDIFNRSKPRNTPDERRPLDSQLKHLPVPRPMQFGEVSKQSFNQQPQATLISSKLYKNDYQNELHPMPQRELVQRPLQEPDPGNVHQHHHHHQPANHQSLPLSLKPPKIVSYNYFESPNEPGSPGEMIATNYQLGDALYSSSGGVEQTLSNGELEAIHTQFMTSEHPVVPAESMKSYGAPVDPLGQVQVDFQNDQLGHGIKTAGDYRGEVLQRIHNGNSARHNEEIMKEMASNEDVTRSVGASQILTGSMPNQLAQPLILADPRLNDRDHRAYAPLGPVPLPELDSDGKPKRKSLIVYLNHPRPIDMSKVSSSNQEAYNLAQAVNNEHGRDSFVSAKEFDSHGLSKENKHLDVSNLHDFHGLKEGQDKDGLSVVVIGDAYKYKKIVLLISSKAGGLKFIPMVKDMKK